MALKNKEHAKYISILNGKWAIRVKEAGEGVTTRINKMGKKVHEKYFDDYIGTLKDIRIRESQEYGKSWEFLFHDDGIAEIITLSYSNSYVKAFLKMLPNIDLEAVMTLSPSLKEVDGKNQSSLFVKQNGKSIKHAFTRENPNGLPQMELKKFKGNDVWDDTDVLDFLTNMVNRDILPKLGKNKIEQENRKEEVSSFDINPEDHDINPEDHDINPEDLPF